MTCPTEQTHRWKLRDDGRSFVCVLCDEQRFVIMLPSDCINCRKSIGGVAYGFGLPTPPGAVRKEVGPFCETCNDLIYSHMGVKKR